MVLGGTIQGRYYTRNGLLNLKLLGCIITLLERKNNGMIKKIIALLLTFIIVFSYPITASAQVKEMPDGQMFDAEFYAKTYPDVYAALGNDETLLYNHYKTYGIKEGRLPYVNAEPALSPEQEQDKKIYDMLVNEIQPVIPEGYKWGAYRLYVQYNKRSYMPKIVYGCQAFAYYIQDGIYAKTTIHAREVNTKNFEKMFNTIRVGDVVSIKNPSHSMVVLTKGPDYITVVEGNYNQTVHWGRKITKEELVSNLFLIESVY